MANASASPQRYEPRAGAVTGRAADILAVAIELFNKYGVQAVSTNKIAQALDISPGNLHYHFKTKVDILTAAYEQLEAELRDVMDNVHPPMTAENSVAWQESILSTLWRYRFFFSALDFFLQRAPQLLGRFTALQNWIVRKLAVLHDDRVVDGSMKPVLPPNTTERFAANVWMLWVSWIRWEMINSHTATPAEDMSDRAVIYRLLRHHFSLQDVYYGKRAAERLSELIEARAP